MTQTILSILALVALSSASVVLRNNTNNTIQDTDSGEVYAKLYKANDDIYIYNAVSNLGDYGYNDNVYKFCITGVWIFYKDADWKFGNDGTDPSGSTYVWGEDYCADVSDGFYHEMSSLRYAGDSHVYNDVCFSLFKDTNYYNDEYASCNDVYDLGWMNGEASSVIITYGEFTFYTGSGYEGDRRCYSNGFYHTMGGDFNDKFKSASKGCDPGTVRATPSPRNVTHKDENGEFGNFVV